MILTFQKTKVETIKNLKNREIGILVSGQLTWGDDQYNVVSGPWSKGAIPNGDYAVKSRNVVEGSQLGSGFEDNQTGKRWFIPVEALFSTNRGGFGIHPDGNVEGTQGCVGLVGRDASRFFIKWLNTKLSDRPTGLRVEGEVGASGAVRQIATAASGLNE